MSATQHGVPPRMRAGASNVATNKRMRAQRTSAVQVSVGFNHRHIDRSQAADVEAVGRVGAL